MKRHLTQIRKKGTRTVRDPYYAPERDIGVIGPDLLRGAMETMEPAHWEPWLREFLNKHNITYTGILACEAPRLFALALNRIIQMENPVVALEATGFTKLPPEIQMLFYARLGQVTLATIWSGVKDISVPMDQPPAAIEQILNDANFALNGMLGTLDKE